MFTQIRFSVDDEPTLVWLRPEQAAEVLQALGYEPMPAASA
jgi:hypothetical protein